MALNASDLADEIIALFPGDWIWIPGSDNRAFLDALCQGFVAMWVAGALSPGLGPPPPGSYPHAHTITTLTSSLMSNPIIALGYTSAADQFAVDMATETATYLKAQTVLAMVDGAVLHVHTFTTFGNASALKTAILGALSVTGVGIDPFLSAFTTALIDHLTANAAMSQAVGTGHVHTLL